MLAVLLLGCLGPAVPPPESGLAKFSGYAADCHGSLLFMNADGSIIGRDLIAASGAKDFQLWHESEPGYSTDYPDDMYMCRYQTVHRVRFDAKPGKAYRFYVDRRSESRFSMAAYEIIRPGEPDATPVPTTSEQLSTKQVCGFMHCGIDSF